MKRINKILCICIVAAVTCSGCGNGSSARVVKNNNSVDAVLQNGINNSAQQNMSNEETQSVGDDEIVWDEGTKDIAADPNVDIDISVMNSDMTYATVFQLMSEPEKYVGKTLKIKGLYNSAFYESTGLTYHFVLIQDATACCAQGIEFELLMGQDYPDEFTEVIVTGTFDTYLEDGYLYCTLRDAVWSVGG